MALDYDFETRRELQKQRLLRTVKRRIRRQQIYEQLLKPVLWLLKTAAYPFEVVRKSADTQEPTG